MMDANDPSAVACNMIVTRGYDGAYARCDRYISGSIRSERPASFWQTVRDEIQKEQGK